jgi:hypothetical protein
LIVLSYTVLEGEDARMLGASIAQAAFKAAPEAPVVTLRAARKGETIFVADALRARYEETLTSTWQAEHRSSPDAWVEHMLQNDWPSKPVPTASTSGTATPEPPPGEAEPSGKPNTQEPTAEKPKTEPEKPAEPANNETSEPAEETNNQEETTGGPPGDSG